MAPPQSPQLDGDAPDAGEKPALNPSALSVAEVAKLLSAAGGKKVTVEQVQVRLYAVKVNEEFLITHDTADCLRRARQT